MLGALCASGQAIGTREMARLMGWEPTRANRLLGTLKNLGLAEQDGDRRYRPGPAIHLLATQCLQGSGLLGAALPVVRNLLKPDFGFALGVLWQGRVCYLLHAAPGQPIEEGLRRSALYPAEDSSIGMVLESTIDGPARTSAAERARIRKRTYAIQRNNDGQTGSVAVAIHGARAGDPPCAAIAVMANYTQHPPESLAALLHPACIEIAQRLHGAGHDRPIDR